MSLLYSNSNDDHSIFFFNYLLILGLYIVKQKKYIYFYCISKLYSNLSVK